MVVEALVPTEVRVATMGEGFTLNPVGWATPVAKDALQGAERELRLDEGEWAAGEKQQGWQQS